MKRKSLFPMMALMLAFVAPTVNGQTGSGNNLNQSTVSGYVFGPQKKRLEQLQDAERRHREAADLDVLGPSVEVIGPKVLVKAAVLEHVIGGREDGGCDGADGLLRSVPTAQTGICWLSATGVPVARLMHRHV